MKKNYYLKRAPRQPNGMLLAHAEGCEQMPYDTRAVSPLGRFSNPYPALAEARRLTIRADACRHCCRTLLTDNKSLTH